MTRQEETEQEEGHGIVSGQEPSAEEIEQRVKEQHEQTQHGNAEGTPDPQTGEAPSAQ